MRPGARLQFDGREITAWLIPASGAERARLSGGLISLSVTDEAGFKSDSVEFTIDDIDRHKAPTKGAELKVWLGWEPQPLYMGRFKVDSWRKTGPRRTLSVSASAAELTTAIRAAKSRAWDDKTLGEIARKVAAEHGLTPAIHAEVEGIRIPHIDQQHESDLAFLQRLATRNGSVFKVADGRLMLTRKNAKTLPSGAAKGSAILRPSDVSDWTFESTARGDYKAVVTSYRDDATGERKTATAGDKRSKLKHRDRRLYGSQAEAEEAARAQLRDYQRGKKTVDINAPGLPIIFAEGEVTLVDFDPDIDGTFRVRSVRHTLDSSGFRSSLALESGEEEEAEV